MNPIAIAVKGKGVFNVVRRSTSIASRYGVTSSKLERELTRFIALAREFDCRPTFPITSVVLQRNARLIQSFQDQGVEFAIHGLRHVDYSQLSRDEQADHLQSARHIFARAGIQLRGFRGPYLRWNEETVAVLQKLGLIYDASQAYVWDVLEGMDTPTYQRAIEFYRALPAREQVVVPNLVDEFVRIPYSLPDDEALVERLGLSAGDQMSRLWLAVLQQTYVHGELFTVGLHPERTSLCYEPLRALLVEARARTPGVWIARLSEIADWWRARTHASAEIQNVTEREYRFRITGPAGTTALARSVHVKSGASPWADGYQRVSQMSFTIESPLRPVLGVSPAASPEVVSFLRQQGYLVEVSHTSQRYPFYVTQPTVAPGDQRRLVNHIEGSGFPLVRLGRWPEGAKSAIALTGDIDALTLWDYGLRFVER